MILILLGLALSTLAVTTMLTMARPGGGGSQAAAVTPGPVEAPGRLVVNGFGDVAVVTMVYEPDQSSGWHSHACLHAVAVLSGELTVYGADCGRQPVRPGQPYVGGREPHLAVNETDAPVEMIVTHINPATPSPAASSRQETPRTCATS